MFKLSNLDILTSATALEELGDGKTMIITINAHSYNVAQTDALFAEALSRCDVLLPDGQSIIMAAKMLGMKYRPQERIAGWDLFITEMNKLNKRGGKCAFVGSSDDVLLKITKRVALDYPNITVETFSPPYKTEFSDVDTQTMIDFINKSNPDLLWIGMTAPKQEKWTYLNWDKMKIDCHVGCIGAVFDFYAGTIRRAPLWWQRHGLEWLYRLLADPRRMWRRYLIGNPLFVFNVIKEKLTI